MLEQRERAIRGERESHGRQNKDSEKKRKTLNTEQEEQAFKTCALAYACMCGTAEKEKFEGSQC